MSDDQLSFFLKHLANEPFSTLHHKGYSHFSLIVMPRLKMAANNKMYNAEMLACCWANVGAVYETNKAPLRAEMAFKKALMLFPQRVETIHKLIEVQIQTGKFNDAFINVNKALDIEPDNMPLFTERQRIQDDMNYRSEPEYTEDDPLWALNETLANDKFESLINTVLDTDMSDVAQLKCLARAYGGMAHYANYLQVWNTITKLDEDVGFEPADWFFLPVELRESEVIKLVIDN